MMNLSKLFPRSKRPQVRRRNRRLNPQRLEDRIVLAGALDVCLAVPPENVHQGPAEVSLSGLHSDSAGPKADTVTKPFRIQGGGPASQGLPLMPGLSGSFSATGIATGLGRHSGSGSLTLGSLEISETGAVSGTFQGTFVFTAANGDQLAVTYGEGFSGKISGQLLEDGITVVDVEFDAFFSPDPDNSTGRFAHAVGGGWRMIARADSVSLAGGEPGYTAPFDFTWSGRGKLKYVR